MKNMSLPSQQGSAASDKTAERVFPARTLFVKSPQAVEGNPFNRLYGTKSQTKGADQADADDTHSQEEQYQDPASHASRTDDEALNVGTTSEAEDKRDSVGETQLKKDFEELNLVKSGQSGEKVQDMASTHPVEANFDKTDGNNHLITQRFEHRMQEDGTHAVATSPDDADGVQRCEDEPIHIPGAVQGFGVLLTLRETSDSRLEVIHASENSLELLGLSSNYLFGLSSFTDILPEDDVSTLLDQLEFLTDSNSSDYAIDSDNTSTLEADGNVSPEVFLLSGHREDREDGLWKCWTALHRTIANDGLIVLEFELFKDDIYPLMTKHKRKDSQESSPETQQSLDESSLTEKSGMDGEGFDAFSEEDLLLSTTSMSKPLRRIKRSVIAGDENGNMEIFSILSQINEQLNGANDLQSFLKIVVGIIKDITRFHRVMLYHFDEQWNGQVVAELVDWQQTKDLFQGLYFPATDIPAQARALYKINKVRILYDRDQPTARLVCRDRAALELPVDMTHCYLRAMSPIHLKYLANMGVRSSMSISINAFGELWGLIACHTYGETSMRCSFLVRKLCRLVGEQISHNIERLSYAARLTARKLVHSPTDRNPAGYIVSRAEDLLGLFDADMGMLSIGDEGKILGPMENSQEAIALRDYFRMKQFESITPSNDLRMDFPDLEYAPGFKTVAGVMFIPLSRSGEDFLLFFRRGQLRKVHWAGNPYEKVLEKNKGKPSVLLPRQSFKVWSESAFGRCKEWGEDQIETAAVLCLVYGKFIEVWRERQQAVQTSKLASLLLNNAGHEVRTPLNAVINYLEIALEGSLPDETRENLEKSHTASKSLVYVINDLLDLTKSERGNDLFRNEPFDLLSTVREAVSLYQSQASRADVNFSLEEDSDMPRRVMGDQGKIRQVISNVTANALKYTTRGSVTVKTQLLAADEEFVDIAIVVTDTGCGISQEKLDAIFSNFELVDAAAMPQSQADSNSDSGTGLGLAIVARVVRNMNGQLRAESKVGRGSTFTFVFHFSLPTDEKMRTLSSTESVATSTRKRSEQSGTQSQSLDKTGSRTSTRLAQKSSSVGAAYTSDVEKSDDSRTFPTDKEHSRAKQQMEKVRRHSQDSNSIYSQADEVGRRQLAESSPTSGIENLMEMMISSPVNTDENTSSAKSASARGSTGKSQRAIAQNNSVSGSAGSVDQYDMAKSMKAKNHLARARRTSSARSGVESLQSKSAPRSTSGSEADPRTVHPEADMPSHADENDDTALSTYEGKQSEVASPSKNAKNAYNNRSLHNVRAVKVDSTDVFVPHRYSRPQMSRSSTMKTDTGKQQQALTGAQPEESTSGQGPLKILVAEDDAINRSILQKRLQIDKHSITLACDGSDCYDEYYKNGVDYDVILMDMQMPVLDGMAASRKIRQFEETCYADRKTRIPIIAVSASLLESQAEEAVASGIDGWILKPVDFKRLRVLFAGLKDNECRTRHMYIPGDKQAWDIGGWLTGIHAIQE